jgi:hypothetical protein
MEIAVCMCYTGIDPFSGQEVYVARGLRDRKMQRALMQFFKPENYLRGPQGAGGGRAAGPDRRRVRRTDPRSPPREALEARRQRANRAVGDNDHYHTVANPAKREPPGERALPNPGCRPGRTTARRQDRNRKPKGGGSGRRP